MVGILNTHLVALRANQIAGPNGILPISRSSWWAGVKSGHYPPAIKLSARVTVWDRDQILNLLNTLISTKAGGKK
jgi:predicted DNA-binding transcriptional regulator AlpA